MKIRSLNIMLCAQLLACGGDGRATNVDAGSDAIEPVPSWNKVWEAEAEAQDATAQWLAVSTDGNPLLLQRFNGGIEGDASKEYRLLRMGDGDAGSHVFELVGGAVLMFETGTFGAIAVIHANDSLVALTDLNSTWNLDVISTTDGVQWAVGRAHDGRPLVAVQRDATPTTVEVHDPSSSDAHRAITIGVDERLVAVSEDNNGTVHLITNRGSSDVHYAASLENGSEQIPARTGTPYFLPGPDGTLQLFNNNEVFNSYRGLTSWLREDIWEKYDTVFEGSADRHAVREDGAEYAWRLANEDSLFVCRAELGTGTWASIDLRQSPLRSVLAESAMAIRSSTLFLVSRRSAKLYRYELDICKQ